MTLNVITVWEMVLEIRRTTLYNSHVHQLCDYALSLEHDEKLRKQIIADDEKQIESLLAQLAELRTQFHQQCDAMQVNADCDETTIESLRVEVSRLTAENEALRADAMRLDWLEANHAQVGAGILRTWHVTNWHPLACGSHRSTTPAPPMTVHTRYGFTPPTHRMLAPLPTLICECGSHWYRDIDGIPRQSEHDLTHPVHASIGELWEKER